MLLGAIRELLEGPDTLFTNTEKTESRHKSTLDLERYEEIISRAFSICRRPWLSAEL